MENKIPIRFFVVTFLFSWLIWAVLVLNGSGIISSNFLSQITLPVILLGAFGPAVGTIVSLYTIKGKGSLKKHFKSFLSLNFGLKVWLAMFLVLGFSAIIAWFLPELFGKDRIASMLPIIFAVPYLLLMIFLGGGQEEIGWRAYIVPIIEKRHGLVIGSLIFGIIWAIWHIPLWFIPGTSQSYMNFFGFILLCIGYSYFFSWIIEASRNRFFSGVVVHGIANTFPVLFPFLNMEDNAIQIRYWIYCFLIFIIGIITVILRTMKMKKNSV